jgi:hypothetical protein
VRTAIVLDKEARPSTDVMWAAWQPWLPERVRAPPGPNPLLGSVETHESCRGAERVIGSDKRARTAAKRGYLNLQDNHRTSTSYKSIAELVSPYGLKC